MAMLGSVAIAGSSARLSAATPSTFYASGMNGSWEPQLNGDGRVQLQRAVTVRRLAVPVRPRLCVMAAGGNDSGIFAPLVVLTRNVIGAKKFNQFRGKSIALHSQIINDFCKSIGADNKQRQGLIRLAKKNGQKLGFLA